MPSSGHPARGTREPCSRDSSEGRALWVPDTKGAARPSLGPHCAGFPATQRPRGPAHSCPEFEDASRPPHVSADLGQPGGATSPEVKAASWGHSSRSVGAGEGHRPAGAADGPRPSSGRPSKGTRGPVLGHEYPPVAGRGSAAERAYTGGRGRPSWEAGMGPAGTAVQEGGAGAPSERDPGPEARGQAPGAGTQADGPQVPMEASVQAQLSRASGLRPSAGAVLPDRASPGVLP